MPLRLAFLPALVLLGLLILLGVGTLFLGANQSTRVASNLSGAEESGQIAISLLGASIRRAGYSEIVGLAVPENFRRSLLYGGPNIRACRQASFVNPVAGDFTCNAAVAGQPDSLAVWFQADNVVSSPQGATDDCIGSQPPWQQVIDPLLRARAPGGIRVVQNEFFVNNGQLSCRGNGNIAVPQPLIANVADLKLYFGFDDVAYAANSHDVLRPTASTIRDADWINAQTAPALPGASAWDFVVFVHVCVMLRSAEVGTTATAAGQYLPCPQTAAEAAGVDAIAPVDSPDGATRRAVNQVIALRSRSAPLPVEP
jgi:hypothetical protein